MRCIKPLAATRDQDEIIRIGKSGFMPTDEKFQFECRKCLPCRLNIAREKAIRCVHEAKMHESNIFLTLTYDDDHIGNNRLDYKDWQLFIKRLKEQEARNLQRNARKKGIKITLKQARNASYIPYMVTGEYGEKTHRMHWHAILFNYRPSDSKYKYTTDLGEQAFTSEEIDNLWRKGKTEFGSVTMESAGYVARYAAKKLVHGKDKEHDYEPIHRTSCKHAIGKTWIEKNWKYTFENGKINLPNGHGIKIPRYYRDWCKENQPEAFEYYQKNVFPEIVEKLEKKDRKEMEEFYKYIIKRTEEGKQNSKVYALPRNHVKLRVLESRFKQLNENRKI